jgi:polyhydroxybutyrate depolymerase
MSARSVGALGAVALLVVGACSSGDDADDADGTGKAPPTTVAADCAPARTVEPSTTAGSQTFAFEDTQREYLLFVPPDYDGTTAAPLTIGFHGYNGTKEDAAAVSQFGEKGPARGYIVVMPDGSGEPQSWNFAGDNPPHDFAFVDALLEDLTERLCVDEDRIYAGGFSAGSAFAGFLACREPYWFAAVSMVGAFVPSGCPAEEAPAVLAIHGTADPGVPYTGGGFTNIPPAPDTLDFYRDQLECDATPVEDQPYANVQRKAYTGCARDTEAVLYSVVGGGHDWPRDDFSATDTILDFDDQHAKST